VVARGWHKVFEDRILGLAAEAGFWALLSLPAMLLALFGAIGYLNGILGHSAITQIHNDVIRAANDVLTPSTVRSDVEPLVDQVLGRGRIDVVSVGFIISLWSGSSAMSDYVNTITVAYDMRGLRSAWRSRLVALELYLGAVVVGIVLLPALALGPNAIVSLAPDRLADDVSTVIRVLYWPVVGLVSVLLLSTLYTLCLPVRVRWRRSLPGAFLAMGLWLLGSFLVRLYLSSNVRSGSVYGSLAAPIAALLFFYATALAVLLGAELNSAIDAIAPSKATVEGRARSRQMISDEAPPSAELGGRERPARPGQAAANGADPAGHGEDQPDGPLAEGPSALPDGPDRGARREVGSPGPGTDP
jgi:membrane protein